MSLPSWKSELAREKRGVLWGGLMIVAFCAVFYTIYHRRANPDYEGSIIDRWAGYSETQQGSSPNHILLVETTDGRHLQVKVDPAIYESARVGRRIRSTSGQIVILDSKKNSTK